MQKQTPAHCFIDPVIGSVPAAQGPEREPFSLSSAVAAETTVELGRAMADLS